MRNIMSQTRVPLRGRWLVMPGFDSVEYSVGQVTGVPLRGRRVVIPGMETVGRAEWFESFTKIMAGSVLFASEKVSGISCSAAYVCGLNVAMPLEGRRRDGAVIM